MSLSVLPYTLVSPKRLNAKKCLELRSSVTANEYFTTSSESVMEKCSTVVAVVDNKNQGVSLGRNVAACTFDKGEAVKEPDEYFYNLIGVMRHFDWINRNHRNSPFCICCGFVKQKHTNSTKTQLHQFKK